MKLDDNPPFDVVLNYRDARPVVAMRSCGYLADRRGVVFLLCGMVSEPDRIWSLLKVNGSNGAYQNYHCLAPSYHHHHDFRLISRSRSLLVDIFSRSL